jgi:3-dehydroquinate dehydratase II
MTSQSLKPIFILNGPNLNRLGSREPHIYGSVTLDALRATCDARAQAAGFGVDFRQTNAEADLIGWLHEADAGASAVVLNAGAFTHTSIALLDAIKAITPPVVECHLSNPYQREAFRHTSYVAQGAKGGVFGFGPDSYAFALDAAISLALARKT